MKNKKQSAVRNVVPKMMKVTDASAYIGVSTKYIRNQVKAGVLPVFRVNSRNYYVYTEPLLRLVGLSQDVKQSSEGGAER